MTIYLRTIKTLLIHTNDTSFSDIYHYKRIIQFVENESFKKLEYTVVFEGVIN